MRKGEVGIPSPCPLRWVLSGLVSLSISFLPLGCFPVAGRQQSQFGSNRRQLPAEFSGDAALTARDTFLATPIERTLLLSGVSQPVHFVI